MAQHLRAWIAYGAGHNGLFYWRTRSGVEVDFVIYGAAGIVAVEVIVPVAEFLSQLRPDAPLFQG